MRAQNNCRKRKRTNRAKGGHGAALWLKSPWRLVLFSLESQKEVKTFAMGPTVPINWDSFLRWKGDSQSLTYLDNRGGVDNLWAQPIEGNPAKQLTNFTDNKIFSFYWSR